MVVALVVAVACSFAFASAHAPHPSFNFSVDWASGSAATTLPTANFSVRKLEAIHYPPDGKTYAYVDIVNYSDLYYPDSYSTEVGVFSSPDGRTGWQYHGIVVPRGPAGGWDGGGIASPGAAVAPDGKVLLGYAAENSPGGGRNRGIGLAIADHPLGPFVKQKTPIADPHGVCGGTGRCDDVIMQSRPVSPVSPHGEIHLYHSVKGVSTAGIRHRMTRDSGKTWSNSTMVLSTALQPGTNPAETIAGKWFPSVCSGQGGMVLITDGGKSHGGASLHAYVSKTPGDMLNFVAVAEPSITEHPPDGAISKGNWTYLQIGFIPDKSDNVVGVTYALWTDEHVYSQRHKEMMRGYTHTVYDVKFPGMARSAWDVGTLPFQV